jgi:hypothetical protein
MDKVQKKTSDPEIHIVVFNRNAFSCCVVSRVTEVDAEPSSGTLVSILFGSWFILCFQLYVLLIFISLSCLGNLGYWIPHLELVLLWIRLLRKCVTLNICSFVHQCNTFTSYFLLIVDMFRPHTAIFRCYTSSILSRSWCSVMPIFAYVMLPAMC